MFVTEPSAILVALISAPDLILSSSIFVSELPVASASKVLFVNVVVVDAVTASVIPYPDNVVGLDVTAENGTSESSASAPTHFLDVALY